MEHLVNARDLDLAFAIAVLSVVDGNHRFAVANGGHRQPLARTIPGARRRNELQAVEMRIGSGGNQLALNAARCGVRDVQVDRQAAAR
jgi:hypothetical protein